MKEREKWMRLILARRWEKKRSNGEIIPRCSLKLVSSDAIEHLVFIIGICTIQFQIVESSLSSFATDTPALTFKEIFIFSPGEDPRKCYNENEKRKSRSPLEIVLRRRCCCRRWWLLNVLMKRRRDDWSCHWLWHPREDLESEYWLGQTLIPFIASISWFVPMMTRRGRNRKYRWWTNVQERWLTKVFVNHLTLTRFTPVDVKWSSLLSSSDQRTPRHRIVILISIQSRWRLRLKRKKVNRVTIIAPRRSKINDKGHSRTSPSSLRLISSKDSYLSPRKHRSSIHCPSSAHDYWLEGQRWSSHFPRDSSAHPSMVFHPTNADNLIVYRERILVEYT